MEDCNLRTEMPRRIREARGAMMGREFARRCGIANQSISRYEREGNNLPGAELLRRMCLASGVSADWLICLTDTRRGFDETPAQNVSTANATAPHATAIADAGAASILAAPLRDALRAVFGPLRVTAAKTIEPDSASVYAALCGTEAGESGLVRLLASVLNPDGLVAAARALRA